MGGTGWRRRSARWTTARAARRDRRVDGGAGREESRFGSTFGTVPVGRVARLRRLAGQPRDGRQPGQPRRPPRHRGRAGASRSAGSERGRAVSVLPDRLRHDTAPAICRGVIWSIVPECAHQRPDPRQPPVRHPRRAPSCSGRRSRTCPVGVHLAVVDPGVGTARRGDRAPGRRVATGWWGRTTGCWCRPPSASAASWRRTALENRALWRDAVSHTFHGRDIFAPVAAHLAGGHADRRGRARHRRRRCLVPLAFPKARVRDGGLDTSVLFIDAFGNCRLAGQPADLAALAWRLEPGDRFMVRIGARILAVTWQATFGAVASRRAAAVRGCGLRRAGARREPGLGGGAARPRHGRARAHRARLADAGRSPDRGRRPDLPVPPRDRARHPRHLAQLDPGEVLLVAGPSGCGKSTLIRALNGLIPHAYRGELAGPSASRPADRRAAAPRPRPPGRHGAPGPSQAAGGIDRARRARVRSGEPGHPAGEIDRAMRDASIARAASCISPTARPISCRAARPSSSQSPARSCSSPASWCSTSRSPTSIRWPPQRLLALLRRLADAGTAVVIVEHRVEDALLARPIACSTSTRAASATSARWPASSRSPTRAASSCRSRSRSHARARASEARCRLAPPRPSDGLRRPGARGSSGAASTPATTESRAATTSAPRSVGAETVAVLGPNGSGKTTLFKTAIGLVPRDRRRRARRRSVDRRAAAWPTWPRPSGTCSRTPPRCSSRATVREELLFGPRNLGRDADGFETLVATTRCAGWTWRGARHPRPAADDPLLRAAEAARLWRSRSPWSRGRWYLTSRRPGRTIAARRHS